MEVVCLVSRDLTVFIVVCMFGVCSLDFMSLERAIQHDLFCDVSTSLVEVTTHRYHMVVRRFGHHGTISGIAFTFAPIPIQLCEIAMQADR